MRLHSVRQHLVSNPLSAIEGEVHRRLDALGINPPQGEVAVTAGSRGIENIAAITLAAGNWLRSRGAIPCTLEDDEEFIVRIAERFGRKRWMFIPNTLHLENLLVSPDLAEELVHHPRCTVSPKSFKLQFSEGRTQLPFG